MERKGNFYKIDELREFGESLLKKTGMPGDEAKIVLDMLIEADQRGVHTHGVVCLVRYINLLVKGTMRPAAEWKVERDKGPVAVWDGMRSNAQVLGYNAMEHAIKKAKEFGIGMVCLKNTNHNGAGAYYAQMAEKAGMIGVIMSTASPTMAPWGGAELLVGNSPTAVAVPAGKYPPMVLDMAHSVVAFGKIDNVKRQKEAKIPEGWALDKDGVETTDPDKVYSAMPVGAYKGYGLALIIEVLAGILFGGAAGPEARDQNGGPAFTLCAVDIDAFSDRGVFMNAMERRIEELKASRLAAGSKGIFMPGEIEHKNFENAAYEVEIIPEIIGELNKLAEMVSLEQRLV